MNYKEVLNISDHPAKDAGEYLNDLFTEFRDAPTLFLISGGSALKILDYIKTNDFDERIAASVLDERFSRDKEINNFLQLRQTNFYAKTRKVGVIFINTVPKEKEDPEEFAKRYDEAIKKWRRQNKEGKIIALMGMGEDGHVAGVLPCPEDEEYFRKTFIETDKWIVSYDAGAKNQYPIRVTATMRFILDEIDKVIFYAAGENKRKALELATRKTTNAKINEIPAVIINQIRDIKIFTDII